MAIKTFVSQGNAWSQVIGAANTAGNANFSMSTWDTSKINWNDYTIAPVDITWTGVSNPIGPYDMIGGPLNQPLGGCNGNSFINTDFTWTQNFLPAQFTKPAGVRPDVLMGFFSQYVHAMMFIADGQTYVVPFMERLGMVWLQYELNKWTAYDRKEFYAFIDNPEATVFVGTALNKREVQRTISEAKDE